MIAPGILGSFGFTLSPQRLAGLLRSKAENDKVLVLVFLQGGNDGLNTVVPLDQLSALNKVRPHVILPENKLHKLNGTSVGLHPSLSGFRELFDDGKLGIVQAVGYSDQNYSHFRSTDIWMSGSDAHELVNSGWTGRYLNTDYPGFPEGYPNETTTDPLAIEIGYGSSLLFQGPSASMSTVISNPESFYQLIGGSEEPAPDTDAGDKLKYLRLIARQSQQYGQVLKSAAEKITSQKPFPETDLAQQLKIVSRLISGGLKTSLYMVRLGGFDTHDAQVEASDHTKGEHAELLTTLNDAVVAFLNDLEFQGVADRVVGMTFSEFGRRIVSNASLGTDHGAAAPMFLFGNKIKGGVQGNNPVISSTATHQDNLEKQFDFRQIYGSLLEQWFGTTSDAIPDVLLDSFDTIPVIGEEDVVLAAEKKVNTSFFVFPNPVEIHATIEFKSTGQPCLMEVIDLMGKQSQIIYSGQPSQGIQTMPWNASALKPGKYFIRLRESNRSQVCPMVKL